MKNSAAAIKEERKGDDFIYGDQGGGEINTEKVVGTKPVYSGDTSKPSSSPKQTNPTINDKENQLESTKAAMCEVREENERLKAILAQIVRDYQSLQMHFVDIMKKEEANIKPAEGEPSSPSNKDQLQVHHEEHELVSLSLGSSSSAIKKQEEKTNLNVKVMNDYLNDYQIKQGLTLGLESKREEGECDVKNEVQLSMSTENSSEGTATKEETATGDEKWPPPSKAMKSTLKQEEDEVAPQAQVKRARVSVRARCDAPTMNDGCQWRKYGQKIAKGNPCPRAYYRCTVAPGCPVRKQVQRCAEDMSILITTYEGNHNHPLPISATAMASTTAAAASMLISGSSSSSLTAPPHSTSGLNFSFQDNSHHNGHQFYFTNPSITPSLSQPTITLDLTSPSPAAAYQPNRFSSSSSRSFYSPASFNFSPSESPSSWNSSTEYLSYGAHQPYYKSYNMGALRQSQESLFHSIAQKQVQNPITDTIAKAITSDPSFQSALAAAITSYVGGSVAGPAGGEGSSGNSGTAAFHQLASSLSTATATTTMGSYDYLAGSTSSNLSKQQGNLIFYPPSLGPSSSSKNGATGSPRDNS